MNKILALSLLVIAWPPACFPPMSAGPKLSTPASALPQGNMTNEESAAELQKEIMNSDAHITEADAKIKRTDIHNLMTTGAAVVRLNGKVLPCDAPGCTETPVSFWIDSESGCRSCRCAKHK